MYVCDNGNDRILIFNTNGEPKSIFSLDNYQQPRKICIAQELVYVLHKTDNEIFISVFDKRTQKLMYSLQQNEFNIKSFYVDSHLNLLTIGQPKADDKMQYLSCSKRNGQLIFKTILNIEKIIWDFIIKINTDTLEIICVTNEGFYVLVF
jgi:hypothetical protein